MTEAQLRWDKPGPGAWTHDASHSDGPTSRVVQPILAAAFADGFRDWFGRYGLPLSHLELRFVNDHPYDAVRLAGVPPSDRRPPPPWVLRLLVRLHPEMRRRERTAGDALARRIWQDELAGWETEIRPAQVRRNLALQEIDPSALDDDGLAAHVHQAAENLRATLFAHFALLGASSIPIGLHLVRSADPREAIEELRGAGADSTGAPLPALAAIARELDAVGAEPRSLDDVRQASPASADALDAYLLEHGQRVVTQYDVTGKRLVELPDAILQSIAAAGHRPPPAASATPPRDDPLLADARRAMAARDDHAGTALWAMGLLRRALLAASERLLASGGLTAAVDVFACDADEIAELLRGATTPSAAAVAARAGATARAAQATPPPALGVGYPPPDPALFGPGMRQMSRAMFAVRAAMEAAGDAPDGEGIGTRRHRGRAVVAARPEDAIDRLRPGDVLVTTMTTPACNCILPIVGALVTVLGGSMSHAGIAARELDIPAVLGVRDAVARIPDGAIVEVDPVTSTVRVCAADGATP